jgi:hypothetical protein
MDIDGLTTLPKLRRSSTITMLIKPQKMIKNITNVLKLFNSFEINKCFEALQMYYTCVGTLQMSQNFRTLEFFLESYNLLELYKCLVTL